MSFRDELYRDAVAASEKLAAENEKLFSEALAHIRKNMRSKAGQGLFQYVLNTESAPRRSMTTDEVGLIAQQLISEGLTVVRREGGGSYDVSWKAK
jgi:hypothetical protein